MGDVEVDEPSFSSMGVGRYACVYVERCERGLSVEVCVGLPYNVDRAGSPTNAPADSDVSTL